MHIWIQTQTIDKQQTITATIYLYPSFQGTLMLENQNNISTAITSRKGYLSLYAESTYRRLCGIGQGMAPQEQHYTNEFSMIHLEAESMQGQ